MIRARYTIAAGLLFWAIAVAYYLLSHDAAGSTMLFALGAAMWLMSYVLIAGSPNRQ